MNLTEYKEAVLAKADPLTIAGHYVGELKRLNDREYRFRCPFHDDNDPSANINAETGLWYCHACNAKGDLIELVKRAEGKAKFRDALDLLADTVGVERPTISRAARNGKGPHGPTEEEVAGWHEVALRNLELMTWFHEHRGFTDETVREWQLGWDGQRVTIPVRDEQNKLVNVRRYKRDNPGSQGKMIGYAAGMNEARLLPLKALEEAEVLLVEGEWDMILARQYGFNALTVTSGAGIFNNDWIDLFDGKSVLICYDNDAAGRNGTLKVAQALISNESTSVSIVKVPGLPDKGDITDFFVEQGRSRDELESLLNDAEPFVFAPVAERGDPLRVPLHEASNAVYRGKYLEVPVLVSGKAATPYTVPADVTVSCDMSNKRFCGICPLRRHNGTQRITLDAREAKVLELINVTGGVQQKAIRAMAGAIESCPRATLEVHAATNIEELRVIPEIDTRADAGEVEHVSRTAYFIGHGLRSNRSYTALGYTHPLPKTQATVHVLSDAIPAQDNISAFKVTTDITDVLRIFEGPVERQFDAIYDDLRTNVHRIQGRRDMQIAYDLVWHSVISFTFNGSSVRRGWTEAMVMGDSGQGKTEMAMSLLGHYGLGERVQGEQASAAGLLGGVEKMGDTWMLGWGKIPLNDKRLLVIDETQGLDDSQIEGLSDVRATGVAEITKIRTERTNARCRIVWLANPVSGRPLAQHNQGVLAIRELFKKPEDVRRLDLAIVVASGDVPLSEINRVHGEAGIPRYTAAACRSLVLWAWSRRPDQVHFTSEATSAILEAATDMGQRYSAAIPLVEPADQRLKIARLAVAAAARVHSTDASGELVVVTAEHVAFVAAFLERIYSSTAMAYDEFSGQQKQGERLEDGEAREVSTEMDGWRNTEDATRFFRNATIFKRQELIDVVGWDEPYTKSQLHFLARHRLIRGTREGYVKTPVFIGLLRTLYTAETLIPPEEGAPF